MTNNKEGFSIAEVSSALNEEDRADVVVNTLKAEHDALVEERAAREAKYQKSIQSLYTKIEQLQYQLEYDYAIGVAIRYKIIPCAVSWFTKEEAAQGKEFGSIMSADLIVPDFTIDHNPTIWDHCVENPFVESGLNQFFDSNEGGNQNSGRARGGRIETERGRND
ncbi:hypothetical protein TSUD_365280 [Trifolium subterraneum]|uniref:Uncharacterized protein n=1 Tax=Trifolium subterraneum TaxID=3900 RepID=A0A2Z6P5B8_TRISU|nr:hypothetical protein TSUD_365280 [Trifolium subterraneum]